MKETFAGSDRENSDAICVSHSFWFSRTVTPARETRLFITSKHQQSFFEEGENVGKLYVYYPFNGTTHSNGDPEVVLSF